MPGHDDVVMYRSVKHAQHAVMAHRMRMVIASGYNKAGLIQDLCYEDWQAVMNANARGAWFMAKVVGTYWIENSVKGKMLMMSSVRGRHGNVSGYTGYCTSKGASDGLTRVLATEWGQYGITVNAIASTVFRSKLTAWMWSDDSVGQARRYLTCFANPILIPTVLFQQRLLRLLSRRSSGHWEWPGH